jgi:hypothetical protein
MFDSPWSPDDGGCFLFVFLLLLLFLQLQLHHSEGRKQPLFLMSVIHFASRAFTFF